MDNFDFESWYKYATNISTWRAISDWQTWASQLAK
jgi:hypothetical protein